MELDLVTALTAANITVLQPSHIQQEDKPVDVPYLFVRLISVVYVQILSYAYLALHFTISHCTIYIYSSLSSFVVQFYHRRQSTQESSS